VKIFRHAINAALYLGLFIVWLINGFANWAERRLERMAFGDGPNTGKEWIEAVLFWVALGLIIHFYF
jgi:hypothetical protein